MSYSGKAKFEYEIERMKHKVTGDLIQMDSVSPEMEDAYEYVCIPLTVEGESYFQEGKTHGLPENCYPDEGSTEINSIVGPDGKDWEDQLTGKEKESILESIASQSEEGEDDYEPDESDYDDTYEPDYDDSNW